MSGQASYMVRYSKIIGTGGIGGGVIYRLIGNHDLGRNESRPATLLDQKDFCKLHIIFHYIAKILKEMDLPVDILPVGAVGDDDVGHRMLNEMKKMDMELKYVRILQGFPTLFGICFTYPDGSGGNIMECNSASDQVSPDVIRNVKGEFEAFGKRCLVLAAPEVPLVSRQALLEVGREYGAFTSASFVSEEMSRPEISEILALVDLLSLNIEEAAMLSGLATDKGTSTIVRNCWQRCIRYNPDVKLVVTDGRNGLYAFEHEKEEHLPALPVDVVNTAGAGDALLSGLVIGLASGLPFLAGDQLSSVRLGRLFAAMSVTSADTINSAVDLASLCAFARHHEQPCI